jgi:hypothetical protein
MKFYTYLWLREDGTPYYVGKGQGNRAYVSGNHRLSCPKDTDLIIVQEFESEEDAFFAEKFLISFYGRKDLSEGCLRNLTDGGEGASGATLSEEHKRSVGKHTSARLQTLYADPILGELARKENSERLSEYFKNPLAREKASEAAKKAFSRPEVIVNVVAGQRRRFDNPEMVAKHAEGQRKRFESKESRDKASELSRKAWEEPGLKAHQSEVQLKLWADPVYRAKMTEKRRIQGAIRKQKSAALHVRAQG